MGKVSRRRLSGSGHREALLEGAIECLLSLGYGRTTARAVVDRSQTNLGSIAYHFGSIEKLREEALIEAATRWLAPIIAAAEGGRGEDGLRAGWSAFLESLPGQRGLAGAFCEALAQASRKPKLRRRLARAYRELREALGAGPGASLVIALFDGLMIQWLLEPPQVEEVGPALARLGPAIESLSAP